MSHRLSRQPCPIVSPPSHLCCALPSSPCLPCGFPALPHHPSLSSFHPLSTPRAVAHEAGGGWCVVLAPLFFSSLLSLVLSCLSPMVWWCIAFQCGGGDRAISTCSTSALTRIVKSTEYGLMSQTGMPAQKKRLHTVRSIVKTPMTLAVVGGYVCMGVGG